MALILEKDLLVDFEYLKAAGIGIVRKFDKLKDERSQEVILQTIHDLLLVDGDKEFVMDSQFKTHVCRQLHQYFGLHIIALNTDTSAGTGSLSSQSIDSFSQTNTMAKNNSPFDDWLNMTQYGTTFLTIKNMHSTFSEYG